MLTARRGDDVDVARSSRPRWTRGAHYSPAIAYDARVRDAVRLLDPQPGRCCATSCMFASRDGRRRLERGDGVRRRYNDQRENLRIAVTRKFRRRRRRHSAPA